MPRITPASIDTLYDGINVDTFAAILNTDLKKAGRDYRCLSPFANEKSPSFFVWKGGTMYKCFSSGNGGTAVDLLMKLKGYSYPEALEWLAKQQGIELAYEEETRTPEQIDLRDKMERSLASAIDRYSAHLHSLPAEHPTWAGELIGKRELDTDTIHQWGLGYAGDDWQYQSRHLVEQGWYEGAEAIGILSKSEKGGAYDRFRNAIMFPIHDERGNLVSLAGRNLSTEPYTDKDGKQRTPPKYINGKDSEMYNKSAVLYGAHHARKNIKLRGEAYLVEGYYDVINMHRAGCDHTVATCGTALTELQCRLLQRLGAKRINICRDGDPAGTKAAMRDFELLIGFGFEVRIVTLPDGLDPDDFARQHVKAGEKFEPEMMMI